MKRSRLLWMSAIALVVVIAVVLFVFFSPTRGPQRNMNSTVATVRAGCANPAPGKYIIKVRVDKETVDPTTLPKVPTFSIGGESVAKVANDMAHQYNFTVVAVYDVVLGGFAASIPDE